MCANSLKRAIMERGLTTRSVANILDVDWLCMCKKINNVDTLTIGEAIRLKMLLGLSDAEAINIFLEV